MKYLVTGSYGQLGSELLNQLDADAVGVDIDVLDITDPDAVLAMVRKHAPEVVINTAAFTAVDKAESEWDACLAVNATAVRHLAVACNEVNARLVQISTDYVFGGDVSRNSPYVETAQTAPQGAYARSKLAGEQEAIGCRKHLVVRTCGLYGPPTRLPGQPIEDAARPRNFVDIMLKLASERDALSVVNDQHCTPTYVAHLANAIQFLAELAASGIYHVVNSGATTWFEMAACIFRLCGYDIQLTPITTAEYGAPSPRPAYSVLDTTKYHALDGPAMPSWEAALEEYLTRTGALKS